MNPPVEIENSPSAANGPTRQRTPEEQARINERMRKVRQQRALKKQQKDALLNAAIEAIAEKTVRYPTESDQRPYPRATPTFTMDLPPMDDVGGPGAMDCAEPSPSESNSVPRPSADSVPSAVSQTDQSSVTQGATEHSQRNQNLGSQSTSVATQSARNTESVSRGHSSDHSGRQSADSHTQDSSDRDDRAADGFDGLGLFNLVVRGAALILAGWLVYKQVFDRKTDSETSEDTEQATETLTDETEDWEVVGETFEMEPSNLPAAVQIATGGDARVIQRGQGQPNFLQQNATLVRGNHR